MFQKYVKYVIFAILVVGGVPWYWKADRPITFWFGMPPWFVVSVGVSICVSILTALQFSRPWPEERAENQTEEAS